jgi:hypothetical protein
MQFQTILKIISHYFQNQSGPLKKTKDLQIRSPQIGQNSAEVGLRSGSCDGVEFVRQLSADLKH